jgi:hypothetical protein
LFRGRSDANLLRTVPQTRLKSSFIYLANAVSDLRGNWVRLAFVLAPLVLIAALCFLPEALNLQHWLASGFGANVHSVSLEQAQESYPPAAAPADDQLFSAWTIYALGGVLVLTFAFATLIVLCQLARIQQGVRAPSLVAEGIEVYRRGVLLAPAFFWVKLLQVIVPAVAFVMLEINFTVSDPIFWTIFSVVRFGLLVFGAVVYLWLYFAPYALVFDNQHSFHALLFSRDLIRKRFFTVATRIVVFLALASGYNSWTSLAFTIVSVSLGPVAVLTGTVFATEMILILLSISVAAAVIAFFLAAGLRLYQDLRVIQAEEDAAGPAVPREHPTEPLTVAQA